MKPGENGELIFEGGPEARVAAYLLSRHHSYLIKEISPSLSEEQLSYFDFISLLLEDKVGAGDTVDYVIENKSVAKNTVKILGRLSSNHPSGMPYRLSREAFMARRLADYRRKLSEMPTAERKWETTTLLDDLIDDYCRRHNLAPKYLDPGDLARIMSSAGIE